MSESAIPKTDLAPHGTPVILPVSAWNGMDSGLNWLWHGFSTRHGGVSEVYSPAKTPTELNLGFTAADSGEHVRENRLRLVEAVTGSRETPLITVRQIHSNLAVVVRSAASPPVAKNGAENGAESGVGSGVANQHCDGDGLMTSQAGVLIGIQTADCIPVLVADPVRHVVAAFHAGWRGTVERIVEHGIAQMTAEYGSRPSELIAAIGPGIGPCCYLVGDEVVSRFRANFAYAEELFSESSAAASPLGLPRLNLVEANRRQLMAAGLPSESIEVVGGCTSCHPELFYSHRASGGHAGRMMSVIGIRPS
ncbi:peptidoglycan editing factor PgeF [Acidicapsa ligni]|uniref:peptidoglycan editing factor PgeF n=1 Tax=Acidicapsa ligni TaxID=542300 RepID=UPI0021DF71D9|nr:peptidoglycan editing factor PgeF [Acidicapsa ligni]